MGGLISSTKKAQVVVAPTNDGVDYGRTTPLPQHPSGSFVVLEDKTLGKGAYATVKIGLRKEDMDRANAGERGGGPTEDGLDSLLAKGSVAIKCIDTLSLKLRDRKALTDETRIMRALDHPHIVKMLADIPGQDGMYYLVMERVRGGELFDRIVELEHYTEVQARATAVILLDAMRYLHSKNICHRDLKPENLLLLSKNTDSDIKIADFGFAAEVTGDLCLTDMCGTPNYVAPEVIKMGSGDRGKGYGLACDMWSVGVIIFVLLGGYPPFEDDDQKVLFQLIAHGIFDFHEEYWSDISGDAKDLIKRLLTVDPNERITAEEALRHPWLKLSEADLMSRDLHKNQEAMKRWNHKRKLRRVYHAVIASNRMKNLLNSIRQGAKESAAAEEKEKEQSTSAVEPEPDGSPAIAAVVTE